MVFKKIIFQNRYVELETLLLHGENHLKFPFWLFEYFPKWDFFQTHRKIYLRKFRKVSPSLLPAESQRTGIEIFRVIECGFQTWNTILRHGQFGRIELNQLWKQHSYKFQLLNCHFFWFSHEHEKSQHETWRHQGRNMVIKIILATSLQQNYAEIVQKHGGEKYFGVLLAA